MRTVAFLLIISFQTFAADKKVDTPVSIPCIEKKNVEIYSSDNQELGSMFIVRIIQTSDKKLDLLCHSGFDYTYTRVYSLVGDWILAKDSKKPAPNYLGTDPLVAINDVPAGWIVPIFGSFYGLAFDKRPDRNIADPFFQKIAVDQLPKQLTYRHDSLPVFVQTNKTGGLKIYDTWITTLNIELAKKDNLFSGVATLTDFNGEAQVVEGDYIMLKGSGHKIRKVVPRSKELKTVGWVELEPYPYTVKELEAMKAKIVYFDPPKKKEK